MKTLHFSLVSLAVAFLASPALLNSAHACPDCGCEAGHSHETTVSLEDNSFKKDRKAILAMAGDYEVTFQFQETVAIDPGYKLKKPYHSEATEFVEVLEDTGTFISLQHILVLHEEGEDPRVVKHWRQDWTYQDTKILEFKGLRNWDLVKRTEDQVQGTWSQAVYQVDDSPRYEAIGTWEHIGNRSAWESEITWRPLPRREYTKRKDYQVIVTRNRQTLTPVGWVHEQDNQKLVLDKTGTPVRVIAHESGLNVYNKTNAVDFSAGRKYWKETSAYWSDVREFWANELSNSGRKNVAVMVNQRPLFAQMFAIAKDIHEQGEYKATHRQRAQQLIKASLVGTDQQSRAE